LASEEIEMKTPAGSPGVGRPGEEAAGGAQSPSDRPKRKWGWILAFVGLAAIGLFYYAGGNLLSQASYEPTPTIASSASRAISEPTEAPRATATPVEDSVTEAIVPDVSGMEVEEAAAALEAAGFSPAIIEFELEIENSATPTGPSGVVIYTHYAGESRPIGSQVSIEELVYTASSWAEYAPADISNPGVLHGRWEGTGTETFETDGEYRVFQKILLITHREGESSFSGWYGVYQGGWDVYEISEGELDGTCFTFRSYEDGYFFGCLEDDYTITGGFSWSCYWCGETSVLEFWKED
jgi:hypothetical protein